MGTEMMVVGLLAEGSGGAKALQALGVRLEEARGTQANRRCKSPLSRQRPHCPHSPVVNRPFKASRAQGGPFSLTCV